MNDNGKIIAAVLAGLAIGALLGVLVAPEKGSEIRNRLGGALRRSGTENDTPEETEDHPEFENEGARKARLKRPAQEKLKETRDKITGNGTHAASSIPGMTGAGH
jgi:gas vesicle protein